MFKKLTKLIFKENSLCFKGIKLMHKPKASRGLGMDWGRGNPIYLLSSLCQGLCSWGPGPVEWMLSSHYVHVPTKALRRPTDLKENE